MGMPASKRHPETSLTPRRAATRDRLIDAAREVFAERGFHGASVEDLCERAGFTRGAFYSNFSSKDDLVLEISQRYSERLLAGVAEVAARDDLTPAEVVQAVLTAWTSDRRERRLWWLLQTEFTLHAVRDTAAGRSWATQQAGVRTSLARLVAETAARRGLTLPVSADDFARAAMALAAAGTGQHLLEPRTQPDGALAARVLPVLLGAQSG